MKIIITMAGLGTRFRQEFNCPKYEIVAKNKTLFEYSIDSLLGFNDYVDEYIFLTRKEYNATKFIEDKFEKYNKNYKIIEIVDEPNVKNGQAVTAYKGIKDLSDDEEVLIYNIDTYVEPYCMKYEDIKGDGFIPCFNADGDHWSFVKLDDSGNAVDVVEKRRISDNCTLGAYYFKSAGLYKKIYNDFANDEMKEKYIAPMYKYMIDNGYKINISLVETDKVHVLGTPEELRTFLEEK